MESLLLQEKLKAWLIEDHLRKDILAAVAELGLSQGMVAAGFVRNLVWDKLHNFERTELNDVDLIWHNVSEADPEIDRDLEARLRGLMPEVKWSVKNQARMHLRNGHKPYRDCADAMSFWPELETAVAVTPSMDLVTPFDLELLFALTVTRNPKASLGLFHQRVMSKDWLNRWERLTVVEEYIE